MQHMKTESLSACHHTVPAGSGAHLRPSSPATSSMKPSAVEAEVPPHTSALAAAPWQLSGSHTPLCD